MKRIRIIAVFLLLLACGVSLLGVWQRPPIAADVYTGAGITVDGAIRGYRLVLPRDFAKRAPIVFAFHGIGDSPEGMANYSRLDELAAQNEFILVYPTAHNSMWRTEDVNAENLDTNPDVRFFDQLLTYLSDQYSIDRTRVYAVGMSNGGTFVQLLAVARSNKIAAVAAHSGPRPQRLGRVAGVGAQRNPGASFASLSPAPATQSLGLGSPANRLPIMLVVGADDLASQAMQSDAEHYRSEGHVVEFVSVPGLAHAWSPRHNTEIWTFLAQHPLPRELEHQ